MGRHASGACVEAEEEGMQCGAGHSWPVTSAVRRQVGERGVSR